MDFLLWATRSMHVFCVVVWIGGLAYQAVVLFPVAKVEGEEHSPRHRHLIRRFIPFVWMCVWSILITGVIMMLFDPRFIFFRYEDDWSVLLGIKQAIFFIMCFFAFGYARMFSAAEAVLPSGAAGAEPYYHRMVQFGKINLGLGILALLVAAAL